MLTRALSVLLVLSAFAPPINADEPDTITAYFGTYTRSGGKGIYASQLNLKTGALSEPTLAAEVENPSFLALHPTKPFLYAVGETGGDPGESKALIAFAIDEKSGALSMLNRQSTGGPGACHLDVDSSGKVALAANYGGGSVSSVPIKDDGSLALPASFHQHVGSSVNPRRQAGPHAHSINVSPNGKFAVSADLGLDKILIYKLDGDGKLTPNDPAFVKTPEGGGPRHLSFHPSGKFAFSNNEITRCVTSYSSDPETGAMEQIETESTVPDGHDSGSTAECLVHPSGRFLYVSNRGHNSIAAFAIDEESGKLERIEVEPAGGEIPRGFGIDPGGRFLVVAHQKSNTVAVLKIDPKSGALDPVGKTISVPTPVNVRFFPPSTR